METQKTKKTNTMKPFLKENREKKKKKKKE